MRPTVVLDAAGLDALSEQRPPERLRALLAEAHARQSDVVVPAVVCAEVCRGSARTRAVESALRRYDGRQGHRPAVRVLVTDFPLARRVGAILHGSEADTGDLVDAHLVAACADAGGGLVISSDPDDIQRLSQAVPGVRIVVRPPR